MTNQRTVIAAPGTQSIAFSREFEAPAGRIYTAHVDADLVAQWTGPNGTRFTMREFDARTGGSWSYVIAGPDREWAFHGSFHEVTEPNRIVQTWEYDNEPGHPTIEVFTFVDLPQGRSRIDGLTVFLSVEDRDANLLGGFDSGRDDDFERLDQLLAQAPVGRH
jgi:uncharacterized protein YndB with AHSA1/START domain